MSEYIEKVSDFQLSSEINPYANLSTIILIDEFPFKEKLLLTTFLLNINGSDFYKIRLFVDGDEQPDVGFKMGDSRSFIKEIGGNSYGNGNITTIIEVYKETPGPVKIEIFLLKNNEVLDGMTKFISIEREK